MDRENKCFYYQWWVDGQRLSKTISDDKCIDKNQIQFVKRTILNGADSYRIEAWSIQDEIFKIETKETITHHRPQIGPMSGGPASIVSINGNVFSTTYILDGKPHRRDGPAMILTGECGSQVKKWYIKGTLAATFHIEKYQFNDVNCKCKKYHLSRRVPFIFEKFENEKQSSKIDFHSSHICDQRQYDSQYITYITH